MEVIETLLLNLGYEGKLSKEDLEEGPLSLTYIEIVAWLSSELSKLCELESHVNQVSDVDDSLGFLVEVSSLLKELGCPYKSLTTGQITDRLTNPKDKELLLRYLCTEIEAAKILAVKCPKKKETPMQIELDESKTAKELREMLICLRYSKPPDTITPQQLFGEVEKKLKQLSQPSPPKEKVGELLFSGCLTEKQWFQLENLYKEMYLEYKTRRNLLLTRLDVTVKSFLWSDRLKTKTDEVMKIYTRRKSILNVEPSVLISHVLAAKADLAVIEKTSSASVRKNTKSSINEVVIGAVPDRGGRPEEQQPPPPEVPSWQKNDSSKGGYKPSNPQSANTGYNNRDNTGYKNSNYGRDENSNPRGNYDNNYKGDMSRGNYNKGGRNDYNAPSTPLYQPVNYCAQLGNPQFGFGGYMPAGDNFQQYGIGDGMNQMNQYQSRGGTHRGGGPQPRGGYADRGSGQSRGGRGQRGGRGRGRY